jgi:hypothetical protein
MATWCSFQWLLWVDLDQVGLEKVLIVLADTFLCDDGNEFSLRANSPAHTDAPCNIRYCCSNPSSEVSIFAHDLTIDLALLDYVSKLVEAKDVFGEIFNVIKALMSEVDLLQVNSLCYETLRRGENKVITRQDTIE